MGNGSTKEEKQIAEIATKETKLECPVLVDLGHGTIRHRHEERVQDEKENEKIKIGYFYHPRLNDFSEDATMTYEDDNRLKYVFKGPQKDYDKKLYYIYGTKTTDKDTGLSKEEYKPQGKGYNWPQSYRKANNLYYNVIFLEKENEEEEEEEESVSPDLEGDDMSESSGILSEISPTQTDNIFLKVRMNETVSDIVERISLQILIPSSNIHFMIDKEEINVNDNLVNHMPEGVKGGQVFKIHLRLT